MENRASKRPPIVIYAKSIWDGVWRPRQEFARLLARRGWHVVYTTGPFSTWDLRSEEWRKAPWFGSFQAIDGLAVERVGRLPLRWQGRAPDGSVLRWHASRVRAAAAAGARGSLIALVFDPAFLPHIDQLHPSHTVYFQYEALARLPKPTYGFHDLERRLVERAGLIVSLTPQMAEALPGKAATRARILPSAVRFGEFQDANKRPCPADLGAVPSPRIGYVGSITSALDFDLIIQVARSRMDWQFVFIGPVARIGGTDPSGDAAWENKWRTLCALPNVHYLGQKSASEVPEYMANMHVNALWYRTTGNGWWLLGSPIKLYENLAVGKPVVGTRLAAIRDFDGVVTLANSGAEWIEAITHALAVESTVASQRRIEIARENSWESRTDLLESWLLGLVSEEAVDAPGDRRIIATCQ